MLAATPLTQRWRAGVGRANGYDHHSTPQELHLEHNILREVPSIKSTMSYAMSCNVTEPNAMWWITVVT